MHVQYATYVLWEGVSEGGGSNSESSVPPGAVLGLRDGKEVGVRGAEGGRRSVGVERGARL